MEPTPSSVPAEEVDDPLGPFRPPSRLEPEFHAPVPRPIHDHLGRGRYQHRRRVTLHFGAFFAVSALGSCCSAATKCGGWVGAEWPRPRASR